MSLRDYAGHKALCEVGSFKCRECGEIFGIRFKNCSICNGEVGVSACTCGLNEVLAAHGERERRIAAVIRRASDPLIRRCTETYAILEGLLEEIEALEDVR